MLLLYAVCIVITVIVIPLHHLPTHCWCLLLLFPLFVVHCSSNIVIYILPCCYDSVFYSIDLFFQVVDDVVTLHYISYYSSLITLQLLILGIDYHNTIVFVLNLLVIVIYIIPIIVVVIIPVIHTFYSIIIDIMPLLLPVPTLYIITLLIEHCTFVVDIDESYYCCCYIITVHCCHYFTWLFIDTLLIMPLPQLLLIPIITFVFQLLLLFHYPFAPLHVVTFVFQCGCYITTDTLPVLFTTFPHWYFYCILLRTIYWLTVDHAPVVIVTLLLLLVPVLPTALPLVCHFYHVGLPLVGLPAVFPLLCTLDTRPLHCCCWSAVLSILYTRLWLLFCAFDGFSHCVLHCIPTCTLPVRCYYILRYSSYITFVHCPVTLPLHWFLRYIITHWLFYDLLHPHPTFITLVTVHFWFTFYSFIPHLFPHYVLFIFHSSFYGSFIFCDMWYIYL